MRFLDTGPLFPWGKISGRPALTALRFLLDLLPDQRLLTTPRVSPHLTERAPHDRRGVECPDLNQYR